MKKRLFVFILAICMLITFLACGEVNAPIVTDASESASVTDTTADEATTSHAETTAATPEQTTASETEATVTETEASETEATATETETSSTETMHEPIIFPGFANIGFNNIRDMIEILKSNELDLKEYCDFADETWLEVDFDKLYELSNLPDGYYELGVEWIGRNDYLITYAYGDCPLDENTPLILYEQCSTEEKLLHSMASSFIKTNEQISQEKPTAIISVEETEYGTITKYTVNDDLYYKRMDVYGANGELLWIYYAMKWQDTIWEFIPIFDYNVPCLLSIRNGSLPLDTLLSMTPVKVEV